MSLAKEMISSDRDNQLALVSHLLKNIVNSAVASHLALAPGYPSHQNSAGLALPNLNSPPPPLPGSMNTPRAQLANGYAQAMLQQHYNNGYNSPGSTGNGKYPAAASKYPQQQQQMQQQQSPPPTRYPLNGSTGNGKRVVSIR
jgi:hypothetical protein